MQAPVPDPIPRGANYSVLTLITKTQGREDLNIAKHFRELQILLSKEKKKHLFFFPLIRDDLPKIGILI